MYSVDWKSHIFLMKNKLISDLTSQTKAGRGMAGAPGAAVTQERPEQNHHGTLHIGAQDQHCAYFKLTVGIQKLIAANLLHLQLMSLFGD